MHIFFIDRKLQAACEDDALCKKRFGADQAKKIRLRLAALRAATSLADFWPPMRKPERVHELKADRAGQFSIDIKQPFRLIFVPSQEADTNTPPEPTSGQQELDDRTRWQSIKAIEVLAVEDTHG